jgi:multicomponent Na+:H+ antiporter subunit G
VSTGTILSDVLLGGAVLTVLGSALGVLVMGDVYQKLHFVTPATLVAPVLVVGAVLIQTGISLGTVALLLTAAFLVVGGPFLTHATIRAARIRESDDWRLDRGSDGADNEKAPR